MNATLDGQRKCRRCDAPLSRYNSDALCAGCAKESPGNTIAPSWWLDSEELRHALSSLDLGAALRIIRVAAGLSQLEFATILGWDQAEVSRAERGQRPTLYDIRRLFEVADAIDMPRTALIPVITGGDHDIPSRQQEEEPGMSMNRRELGGTLLGLAAAVGLSPVQIPAKVDPAHVRYFSAAVDQLYAQDQSIGGGALVRDGLRLYDRARRMLDESDYCEETARRLMIAAGELATCVSWLCYDAGDYRTARTLHSNAHMLASQAGDNGLAIRVMQGMALQLVDVARETQNAGYARQAVVLSKRASDLARSEPSPQLHALLAAREAMAQAAVGDFTGFNRAISRAWREMDREDHTEELPRWLKFVNRSEIVTHEARGRWYLGKLSTAEDLYRASLQDQLSPRNEAAQRASLSAVLAARHDFESALTEGAAVLSSLDARKISSSRTIRRLRPVRQGVANYASGVEFAEHYDQIANRGGSV